jgi:hypothetical protein
VTLSNRPGGGTMVEVTLPPLFKSAEQVPLFEADVADTQPVS